MEKAKQREKKEFEEAQLKKAAELAEYADSMMRMKEDLAEAQAVLQLKLEEAMKKRQAWEDERSAMKAEVGVLQMKVQKLKKKHQSARVRPYSSSSASSSPSSSLIVAPGGGGGGVSGVGGGDLEDEQQMQNFKEQVAEQTSRALELQKEQMLIAFDEKLKRYTATIDFFFSLFNPFCFFFFLLKEIKGLDGTL